MMRRRFPSLKRKTTLMFWNRIKSALAAALFAIASFSPAMALNGNPLLTTRTIPQRAHQEQVVQYYRATINYNDTGIASGVQFGTLPPSAYILSIDAHVTTAFNAGTTNVVILGATQANANEFSASGTIAPASATVQHLTSAAGLGLTVTSNTTYQTQLGNGVPLWAKYTQTGTAATAGSVTVVISYILNNDQ